MKRPESGHAITGDQYDVVLFDLDGEITDTASRHAACRSLREVVSKEESDHAAAAR